MNGCDLYRHFNKDGALLYVGISLSAVGRLAQHRTGASWYSEIASVTVEKHASTEAAGKAEVRAIKAEKPLYNKAHNGVSHADQRMQQPRDRLAFLAGVPHDSIRRNIICWTPKFDCYKDYPTYGNGGLVRYPDTEHLSYSYGAWPCSSGGCDLKIHEFSITELSHFVMSTALGLIMGNELDADVVHRLFWPILEYRLGLPPDTKAPEGNKKYGKRAGLTTGEEG